MISTFMRQVAVATLIAGSIAVAGAAQAASTTPTQPAAGTLRPLPTTGLTQYNLGGGVMVFTNTPGAISSFSWNTGSSSGQAFNIGR